MTDCERAREAIPIYIDGGLNDEQSAQLHAHLDACDECRAGMERLEPIDCELTVWGERLHQVNPPPAGARERLAESLLPRPLSRWVPVAAAAIAAAALLAAIVPHARPPAKAREAPFVGIPYLPPLDPNEHATVVRMNVRVSTLLAVGYGMTADPDEIVPADVLVGEDGRAHAVRVIWNSKGD